MIACNPAALYFAEEYRDKIFPGVPIVFSGVGAGDIEKHKISPGVTGVASPWGFRETIDLMLRLQPDTNTIAVVAGDTRWDKDFLAVAHSELLRHHDKVGEIDLAGPVDRKLLERVTALPPHTVVLFQAYPQFENQPEFGTWDLVAAIAQRVPTYSVFPRLCIDGCIGGAYEDAEKQVLWTGQIAARVLLGERPDDIPVLYSTVLQSRVDWRALRRWQIPESALPLGSVVLNREPTLWEHYRKYIITAIAVIAVQLLLILGLLWQRAKRRKTEAALIRSNDQLRLAMDSGKSVGWDLDLESGQNTWFGDLQAVFGIPSNTYSESVADFRHRLHPEDQEPVWKAFSDARQGQKPYAAEFRVLRADATVRWLAARGKFYFPDKGDASRMLGMAVDITEIKQAEEALSGMSRKLIEAHEEERTWIARELHDDINQRLALLAVNLEMLTLVCAENFRTSKRLNVDLRVVGERLNVNAVLEGSIRRAGSRIRIHAQLINVSDGYHLWSERYDRELHDVFEVQDDISRAIANRLKVDLFSLIGGSQTVSAAVEAFYRRILADASINHFFAHSDLARLRAHQNLFVSALLGGPEPYTGRDIGAIHAHFQPRLNDAHFDAFLKHFRAALNEVGVKNDKVDRIIRLLEGKRSSVLNR